MQAKTIALAAALCAASSLAHAQFDFHLAGREVSVHSFASQGFAYSNENNYLTMKTSDGSFAMTDGGVNASTMLTDKFRVGAQFYIRNIGELGNFRPELDWAYGDYRFASWLGLRAGKVKSAIGLHNDTQDLEFLHTWAILPQSVYPLDLRAASIAHTGGDLYGEVKLRKATSVAYVAYAGRRPDDPNGGYRYGLEAVQIQHAVTSGNQVGGDLRVNNLVDGLTLGASYLKSAGGASADRRITANLVWPIAIDNGTRTAVYYAQYKHERLTVEAEYARQILAGTSKAGPMPATGYGLDQRGWWTSAAYRVHRKLELGTYHSRFYPNWAMAYRGGPDGHMFDQAVTARVDLTSHWDVKVEGHFIDGFGSPQSFHGFYPQQNPTGLKPETNMLVIRTGWNF